MTPPDRYSVSPLHSFCTVPRQPQPLSRMLTTISQWIIPRLRRRNARLVVLEAMLVDQLADELPPPDDPAGTRTP
jgi:hypothetical protein